MIQLHTRIPFFSFPAPWLCAWPVSSQTPTDYALSSPPLPLADGPAHKEMKALDDFKT